MHSIVLWAYVPSGYRVWAASEHRRGLLVCPLLRQKSNTLLDLDTISFSLLPFPKAIQDGIKYLCIKFCTACPQ